MTSGGLRGDRAGGGWGVGGTTHVVLLQVRVRPLDAVVENRHDDAPPRVALAPRPHQVHVVLAGRPAALRRHTDRQRGQPVRNAKGSTGAHRGVNRRTTLRGQPVHNTEGSTGAH